MTESCDKNLFSNFSSLFYQHNYRTLPSCVRRRPSFCSFKQAIKASLSNKWRLSTTALLHQSICTRAVASCVRASVYLFPSLPPSLPPLSPSFSFSLWVHVGVSVCSSVLFIVYCHSKLIVALFRKDAFSLSHCQHYDIGEQWRPREHCCVV